MQLWNKYSKEELEQQLRAKNHRYTLVSFYQYAHLSDPSVFRNELFSTWMSLDIIGRTYVAKEGINAQIAVPEQHFEAFKQKLYSLSLIHI